MAQLSTSGLSTTFLPSSAQPPVAPLPVRIPTRDEIRGSATLPERAAEHLVLGFRNIISALEGRTEPIISVYGSARLNSGHPAYEAARELARQMALGGWSVLTGAGPGIMEAANRGAYEARQSKAGSLGVKVDLPREGQVNPYVNEMYAYVYDFFVRKVLLIKPCSAIALCTGGYGTLDEGFEVLNLISKGSIKPVTFKDGSVGPMPVVGVGKEFWQPLKDAFGEHFKSQGGSGTPDNIDLLQIASSAEEAAAQLLRAGISPKRVQVDDEMAFKVWGDLEAGFKTLESVGPRVAIYGSSKHAPNDPFCKLAGRLGHLLGEEKIPVVTCGASALTNSVNAAAKFAGGRSVGISSQHEPSPNGHVTDSIRTTYNCTAKVLATRGATTSIFFPGGFETMDAVFEVLTLHQTGKSDETPTVFVGKPWHVVKAGLKTMLDAGTIEKRDIDRIMVVEKAEHAFEIARASVQKARQQLA